MSPVATLESQQGRAWTEPQAESRWRRWLVVVIYATAMAWVEAAVVFYLRSQMNRLVPYQPQPLPMVGGYSMAEMIREFATLVMLASVGCLAGKTWRSRVAYSLLAFGVWDIAYYVWLIPLTGWPRSILEWDVLFLIPLPWWGPVWAPVCIAALMVLFGTIVAHYDEATRPVWPDRASRFAAAMGGLLSLYVFMADSLRVVAATRSTAPLRDLLPQWFNWPLFLVALVLIAMPVAQVTLRTVRAGRMGT